jgi:hypothetical protein
MSYKDGPADLQSSLFLQTVLFDVRNSLSHSTPDPNTFPLNPRFLPAADFTSLVQSDPPLLKKNLALLAQASLSQSFPFDPSFITSSLSSLLIANLTSPVYQLVTLRSILNFSSLHNTDFISALYSTSLFPAISQILEQSNDSLILAMIVQLLSNCALVSPLWRDEIIEHFSFSLLLEIGVRSGIEGVELIRFFTCLFAFPLRKSDSALFFGPLEFCHRLFKEKELCAVLNLFACAAEYETLRKAIAEMGLVEWFSEIVGTARNDKIIVPSLTINILLLNDYFDIIAARIGRFVELLGSANFRVACGGAVLLRLIIKQEPSFFVEEFQVRAVNGLIGKLENAPFTARVDFGRTLIAVLQMIGMESFGAQGQRLALIIADLIEVENSKLFFEVVEFSNGLVKSEEGRAVVEMVGAAGAFETLQERAGTDSPEVQAGVAGLLSAFELMK